MNPQQLADDLNKQAAALDAVSADLKAQAAAILGPAPAPPPPVPAPTPLANFVSAIAAQSAVAPLSAVPRIAGLSACAQFTLAQAVNGASAATTSNCCHILLYQLQALSKLSSDSATVGAIAALITLLQTAIAGLPASYPNISAPSFANPVSPLTFGGVPAALSTTPPSAGKRLLSAADFAFNGATPLNVPGAGWLFGMAYRASTNTFFSLGANPKGGYGPPYGLWEWSLTKNANNSNLVKSWGPIDPAGRLAQPGAMQLMRGIWFDDATGKLWLTFGSYYNAKNVNQPTICYVTLDGGTLNLFGPWGVPDDVGPFVIPGSIKPAPPELKAATGMDFYCLADSQNTSGPDSWGVKLAAFADPSNLPPAPANSATPTASQTPAAKLIFWPMVFDKAAGLYYGAHPRIAGERTTVLYGNNNVGEYANGPQWSYEFVRVTNGDNCYTEGSLVYPGVWISTPNAEGILSLVQSPGGLSWYGNADDPTATAPGTHWDTSPFGQYFANQFASAFDPTKPATDTAKAHGLHSEKRFYRLYITNPADVLAVAPKAVARTATPQDLQIPPASVNPLETLGGTPPAPRQPSDMQFVNGKLYLMTSSQQTVYSWSVNS